MSQPAARADERLLADLAERFDTELSAVLHGAREVALVNFPNHGNPGDSAIWLGARASLRRLGVRVRYRCAWSNFDPAALAAAHRDGPVLLNGGGNFGDLYQGQQGVRERILAELRDRRLIQLPQSIHFANGRNLDRNRRLVAQHGNVVLMLRELRSLEFAQRHFEAPPCWRPTAPSRCSASTGRTSGPTSTCSGCTGCAVTRSTSNAARCPRSAACARSSG